MLRQPPPSTLFPTRRSSDLDEVDGPDVRHPHVHPAPVIGRDRKSTRLNSSHRCISYAVFCLKKKKKRLSIKLESPHSGACVNHRGLRTRIVKISNSTEHSLQ